MKKNFVRVLFLALAVCLLTMLVSAEEVKPVTVTLNGEKVDCASYGQDATIVEGRTMVPLRAIFEALGADVVWDKNTRTVLSARNGTLVELGIGSNILVKNGQDIEIDVPAQIMNGRTMVPARAVAESFGVAVEWDKGTRTVLLTSADEIIKKSNADFESVLRDSKVYSIFNYGMTMQECWDLISHESANKELVAFRDGRAEIHISKNLDKFEYADSEITGDCDIILVRLIFEGDYLYSVYVISNYCDTLEESLKALGPIEEYYGSDYESDPRYDDSDDTRRYTWKNENQKVECSLADVYESATDVNSRLGNNYSLFLTDIQAKAQIDAEEVKTEEEPSEDIENPEVPSDGGKESELDEKEMLEEAEEVLVKAYDAVITYNFAEAAKYTTNPDILLETGISDLDSLLLAAGLDRASMVEKCIDELTAAGGEREDYRAMGEAMADVTVELVKGILRRTWYEINSCEVVNAERIKYEVVVYTPDSNAAIELFGTVAEVAMNNAYIELMLNAEAVQGKSQKEVMDTLAVLFKNNANAIMGEYLAKIETAASEPSVGALVKVDGEWRVELGETDFTSIENFENLMTA